MQKIEAELKADFYLAHFYLKQRATFDKVKENDLKKVMYTLNNRPSKSLEYRTPFFISLSKLVQR